MLDETVGARAERKSLQSVYDCDLLGTNIAPTSLDSSVATWAEAERIPRDGPFAIIAQTCASRRFVSLNVATASGFRHVLAPLEHAVKPLRLSREPHPFVSNSSANIKACPSFLPYAFRILRRPNSAKPFSQFFNPFELHISTLHLCPPSYPLYSTGPSLTQDQLSVAAYYTKLKELWDELASYSDLPSCTCGAMKKHVEREERNALMQFLMGLN
ncbi:unnamed protein product [Prunus armeniaca]